MLDYGKTYFIFSSDDKNRVSINQSIYHPCTSNVDINTTVSNRIIGLGMFEPAYPMLVFETCTNELWTCTWSRTRTKAIIDITVLLGVSNDNDVGLYFEFH